MKDIIIDAIERGKEQVGDSIREFNMLRKNNDECLEVVIPDDIRLKSEWVKKKLELTYPRNSYESIKDPDTLNPLVALGAIVFPSIIGLIIIVAMIFC